ncbi:MAG: hypothetical protein WDO68_30805 [Gammaproteobacteria bacterium]
MTSELFAWVWLPGRDDCHWRPLPSGCDIQQMKYLPLVWAAFRRHATETLLTRLILTIAFTLGVFIRSPQWMSVFR